METARELAATSSRYRQPPGSTGPSIVLPESTRDLVAIQVVYIQNATDVVDASGRVTEKLKLMKGMSEVSVAWEGSGWLIDEIRVVPS
jgi:hypothetical protein